MTASLHDQHSDNGPIRQGPHGPRDDDTTAISIRDVTKLRFYYGLIEG